MAKCSVPELSSSGDHADEQALDALAGALSHRRRRAVLTRLCRGPATTSELAAEVGLGLPAMHRHLHRLREAGLVESNKEGRVVTHSVDLAPLRELETWLAERQSFWSGQLDALADALEGGDRA